MLIVAVFQIIRTIAKRNVESRYHNLHTAQITKWRNGPGESSSEPKFSPDGNMIAYSAIQDARNEVVLCERLAGGNAIPVTDGQWSSWNPVWSPDGKQLAFVSQREGRLGIWAADLHWDLGTLAHFFVYNSVSVATRQVGFQCGAV